MFSHPPTDYRDCQMQQRLEISGFFLIPHSQLAVVVHPRMCSFHHPTTRTSFVFVSGYRRSFLGHMRDIAPLPHLSLGGLASIAFIHAEVLASAFRWLGPSDHDRVQCLCQQLHVVPISSGDDKRERGATAVHQQAALGPFFSPDQSGCFPQPLAPAALCLASRPSFAIPRQSPPCHRTPPTPLATIARRSPPAATAESNGEWRWRCRSFWAEPSTGNRYAAHRQWRRKPLAVQSICARRQDAAGTCVLAPCVDCAEAEAARHVTRALRKLPKIELSACGNHHGKTKIRQSLFTDKLLTVFDKKLQKLRGFVFAI